MAEHNYSYRFPRHLLRWLMGTTGLVVVLALLYGAVCLYDWFAMADAEHFIAARGTVVLFDVYLKMFSYIWPALILLFYVLFFMWLYRTSANAHAMGADLDNNAGFSVGMFFVPILNLFLPPVMMSELVRASINAPLWRAQPKSAVVALWWTLQLSSQIGGLALRFAQPAPGASLMEFRNFFGGTAIFALVSAAHWTVVALLVGKISRNQRRQWDEFSPDQAEAIFS
jgi:hypothetical protein